MNPYIIFSTVRRKKNSGCEIGQVPKYYGREEGGGKGGEIKDKKKT